MNPQDGTESGYPPGKGFPVWLLAALGGGFGISCGIVLILILSSGDGATKPLPSESDQNAVRADSAPAGAPAAGSGDVRQTPARSPAKRVFNPEEEVDEWDEEEKLTPREQLDRAKKYLSEHPGEYDRAIGVLNAVMRRCQDLFNDEIEAEIEKITDQREKDAQVEFDLRHPKAASDLAAGRFRDAFEAMKSFPDRFCGSSSYERAGAFAKEVTSESMRAFDQQRAKAEELEEAGDFDGALKLVEKTREFGIEDVTRRADAEVSRINRRRDIKKAEDKRRDQAAKEKIAEEGEALFREFLPGFQQFLRRRDYAQAEAAAREALAGARNPRFSDLIASELADVPRIRDAFSVFEKKLAAFENREIALKIRGKEIAGVLVRLSSASASWGLKTPAGSTGLDLTGASSADVARICTLQGLDPSELFSLGLFLLAEGRAGPAAAALEASGLMNPRIRQKLADADRKSRELEVDEAIDEAQSFLDKKEFDRARKTISETRDAFKDGVSKAQSQRMEDVLTECATQESGIRDRFRCGAWALPDGRNRLLFRFDAGEEILDWKDVQGGEAGIASGRLEVRHRGVLWSRFRIKTPFEITMDAQGDEVDVNLGGREGGDWKDGVHVVIGREGKAFAFRNGERGGEWPVKLHPSSGRKIRLVCDSLNLELTLEIDGTHVFTWKPPGDDKTLEGRIGLWGHPSLSRYDNIEVLCPVEIDAAAGAAEPKPVPKKPVRLFTGSVSEGWTQWKGEWKAEGGEIHGSGNNVALVSTVTAEYKFTEYTFQVEVRLIKGQESAPGLVFMFGGRFPLWIFDNLEGKVHGIPDAVSMKHELDKRWTTLTVIVKNGKAEGFVGSKRVWSAQNPSSAASAWDGCPPGIGLVSARGSVVFRNPVITIAK